MYYFAKTEPSEPTASGGLSSVIAIAVSTGGLQALTEILAPLPADFPATILVAMHLHSSRKSHLAEILGKRTALTVREARSGDRIRAGTVFVAPRDYHLLVTPSGVLWLSVEDKVHSARPAADPLLTSAANVYGDKAIGIVLTGEAGDGASGIKAIKRAGGKTISQDEATSKNPGMPHSAIATGLVDRILPLGLIAQAIVEIVLLGTGTTGPAM